GGARFDPHVDRDGGHQPEAPQTDRQPRQHADAHQARPQDQHPRQSGMATGMKCPKERTSPCSTVTWCSVGSRRMTGCTNAYEPNSAHAVKPGSTSAARTTSSCAV